MQLSKVASVLSFFGALALGIVIGYFADDRREILAVEVPAVEMPAPPRYMGELLVEELPIRAENVLGV